MTKQELITYNRDNNIHYIKVDSLNRVTHNDPFKRNSDWIQIEWDDRASIMDTLSSAYVYDATKGSITEVPLDTFDDYRKSKLKVLREDTVSAIAVTTSNGNTFDGDDKSQIRMIVALDVAKITMETTIKWKLLDNRVVTVDISELEEALVLSNRLATEIWLKDT